MIKSPLVSIVVPSYNHASFIEKCINSILTQDYDNYELIVIDDGSTDNSDEILSRLHKKYGFYLEFNKNQGLAKTLNRGFKEIAKGKYLASCASDDYWLPNKLTLQVEFLETNPDYAMVFGKAITSLIESQPANKVTILSNPNATPPCGGAPYFNASNKNPNLSFAS